MTAWLPEFVEDAESDTVIVPLDIVEFVADDTASSALQPSVGNQAAVPDSLLQQSAGQQAKPFHARHFI